MSLSGWDDTKKLELTIDHTKIDETLTDFPLLVSLAPSSYSDFFSELAYGSVDDEFIGNNGDAPNSKLWSESDPSSIADIQNNKLNIIASGVGDKSCAFTGKYKLTGNFDIQIDFDVTTLDEPVSSVQYANILKVYDGTKTCVFGRVRIGAGGNNGYYKSGTDDAWASHVNADASGKLRVIRSGSTIKCYYWHSSQWEWDGNTAGYTFITVTGEDVSVQLWTKQESDNDLNVNYDNFTVNSGLVAWPEGTHPNRKKIALTENDEITQCPVEIEQWDFYAGKVNLWTKVSTIVSGTDTLLYLYYDKSHADNTTYVGDIGSTPAQNVWDENFVGVWHMNQDPSVGGACIKDSTVSGSHGTVSGTMTSGDLVDGKIGKALDFDGTDDEINFGNNSIFDLQHNEPHTLESIFKSSSVKDVGLITRMKQISPFLGYDLRVNSAGRLDSHLISSWPDDAIKVTQTSGNIIDGNFHYGVTTYDGSLAANNKFLYVDGFLVQKTIDNDNLTSSISFDADVRVGRREDYAVFSDFVSDETRISNIARSPAWIKATYYSSWADLVSFGIDQVWDDTKKLKLTIDNTKIDSTLTDFPILVSLSSSCGIGGYDARCVFDELYAHPYEVCDDFTWVNSSIPNPNLWRMDNSPYIDIYNNKLRFADVSTWCAANSEFSLSGDFNIQVDFEIINGPSTNSWGTRFMIQLNDNSDTFEIRREYSTNQGYRVTEYINGVWTTCGQTNSTDTSGKLCIVRSGNTFSGYFWHSDGYWYKLGSNTYDATVKDIRYIKLLHGSWSGNPAFSFYFDNFKVNNGTPYFSSRLAITATVSGIETQCYTEIEKWEQENNKAFLWVKVPTVASGSDTELSLYYDKSHLNNWNYINFVGTAVGKAVWDDNFVGVWHMNQDPTGSASCIKDSTSNANHGTPGGSMTSGDLVDGKVGKALDFDGNDSITVAADSTLKFGTGDFTIESVFKTASATAQVLVGYGDRADNPGWTAQFTNQGYAQFLIDDGTTQSYMGDTINHADGAFHLQSAVLNRSGNGILYIDSVIADTADISGSNLTLDTIDHDDIEIGRVWYNLSFTNYMVGIIDEVRISNIARSASWIKATYYSNWDNLITYDRAKNYFSGTVKVENVLSARKVNLYDQITGELLGFTTSTSGIWAVDVYGDINTKYFAVCVPEFEGRNAEIFAHLTGA